MFKNMSKPFLGFLQATGLVSYIVLISAFLSNITNLFKSQAFEVMAPIIMLLAFILSAVVSASIVLGNAGVLFWEKKYSEAFTLIAWTVGWGTLYFVLIILVVSVISAK